MISYNNADIMSKHAMDSFSNGCPNCLGVTLYNKETKQCENCGYGMDFSSELENEIDDYGQSLCCKEGRIRYRGGSVYFCNWCGKEEIRPCSNLVKFDDLQKYNHNKGDQKMKIMTNETYARTIKVFRTACKLANVEPTTRQASKFQRRTGRAYACKEQAKLRAYKR